MPAPRTLHLHPFAAYCWKPLIALYERAVPFEPVLVEDRAPLAAIWPPASIPVLVEGDLVLPESSTIVEHLDAIGDAPPLVADLEARLWDRIVDGHVATPMQAIVADALRPEGDRDPHGVERARAGLRRTYALLDDRLAPGRAWLAGAAFTLADCAAAPALFYADVVERVDRDRHRRLARYLDALLTRPSVARVVDEARPYRALFPLPWPAHVA
jgi:glutathione S-transferase